MRVVESICLGRTHAIAQECCMYASEYWQWKSGECVAAHELVTTYSRATGGTDDISKVLWLESNVSDVAVSILQGTV